MSEPIPDDIRIMWTDLKYSIALVHMTRDKYHLHVAIRKAWLSFHAYLYDLHAMWDKEDDHGLTQEEFDAWFSTKSEAYKAKLRDMVENK